MTRSSEVKATVRIITEGFFDLSRDAISWLLGNKVKLHLVSLEMDAAKPGRAKVSSEVNLSLGGGVSKDTDSYISVAFRVDESFGTPGAILLENHYEDEFFLKSITLDLPDAKQLYFPCHSWIVHHKLNDSKPRVFFPNQVYLPSETPASLAKLREYDLAAIQGQGQGERVYGNRVQDYAVYNDLGNPDDDNRLARTVLGGSQEFPYPRRCRTGRKHTKYDPASEEPATTFDSAYVPRDERFSAKKKAEFLAAGVRSFGHDILSLVGTLLNVDDRPFEALEQIFCLYVNNLETTYDGSKPIVRNATDGTPLEFPPPGLLQVNKDSWKSDREFARQRLAGTNPLVIERVQVFPPVSNLDIETYGDPMSTITFEHLEPYLEGLTVEDAMKQKRLYMLDYHDSIMPYVNKINDIEGRKVYASRTIFYLTKAKTLIPVAIELTLPPKAKGEKKNSRVFTASRFDEPHWRWRFAKAHVAIVDEGYHQLVSHWLRTHACVEPFIIATRRQLSCMHPLHVLLSPHFKDTMHINAMARTSLINAEGIIENNFTPGKYSMEISSVMYKNWRFDEQALPKDLIKRGMAEEDAHAKNGIKLTIEDYPYAVDGLELWEALKQWVGDYVGIYYKDDKAVQDDVELQNWWREVRTVGHGDHSSASWWVDMRNVGELVESLTTIMWMASALHAAVNFGQYAYSGYMPNTPSMGRRLIPEDNTPEYRSMLSKPEKFYLEMLPMQSSTTQVMAVLEILAQHMSDEEYLGNRSDDRWTNDERALSAFQTFKAALTKVEASIEARNNQDKLHHRAGVAFLPYTLLVPSSPEVGLTFRGVPNSISI